MITSAPLALRIEGASYEFHPLTFEDFEWLELKLRARAIEAGRQAGVDINVLLDHAKKIDIFNELDSMQSPIVLSWMLQRMLRHAKPPVPAATVELWLRTASIRDMLLSHISALCGLGEPEKNPATAEEK